MRRRHCRAGRVQSKVMEGGMNMPEDREMKTPTYRR